MFLTFSLKAQKSVLVTPESAFTKFQEGERLYLKGAYLSAIPLLEEATSLYENNYDGQLVTSSLHSLALLHTGQKNQAYNILIQAASLMNGDKTNTEEALVAYNLCVSRYYWESYELSKALDLSQGIEKKMKVRTLDLTPAIKIELYEYLGAIKNSKGDYKTAVQYYKTAIDIADKMPPKDRNQKMFKFDYFKLGELYQKRKKNYKALELYTKIEERKADIYNNNVLDDIELKYQLGVVYSNLQEYDRSIELLKTVAENIKTLNKKGHRAANTNARIGAVMIQKKLYKEAIEWNTQALKFWNNFLQIDDLNYIYEAYLNQGLLYQQALSTNEALAFYRMTVSDSEKDWETTLQQRGISPLKSNQLKLNSIHLNLSWLAYEKAGDLIPKFPQEKQFFLKIELHIAKGDLLFKANNYNKAKTYYQEALKTMKSLYQPKHPWISEVALKLSKCLLLEKDYSSALALVNEAVNATLKEGKTISTQEIPKASDIYSPFELLNAIRVKGLILSKVAEKKTKKELQRVLDNCGMAIELVTRLRRTHRNDGERYKLSELTSQICTQAVLAANSLYELTQESIYLEEIFNYEELSKSANLLETLRDLKAKEIANIPQEFIDQEYQIKVTLSYLRREIFYESRDTSKFGIDRIDELREKVTEKTKEHQDLLKQLEKAYPRYYKMKYDYKGITIQELQKELTEEEAFLEYMVNDSFIFVLAITKDAVFNEYKKTPVSITGTITNVLRYIRTHKPENFAKTSHDLYKIIIGEVFLEKIGKKKLIVVPDGALSYLPFGILVKNKVTSKEQGTELYTVLDYLIEDCSIVYNYSANLFLNSINASPKSTKDKICAWAPSFVKMGTVLREKNITDMIMELPAAKEEADMIAKLFEGQVIAEESDMESNFKQHASDFSVLHIATHGIIRDKDPIFSNLVFNKGQDEDGILHTYELFNMQLNAELAVLSACNSGVGELEVGEGVISIARGFAYAGVPNIVMSTWAVSDEATKILMHAFYLNLKEGLPKGEALQQAKVEFLEESGLNETLQDPFFWGSFVVLGNTNPVYSLVEQGLWRYWKIFAVGLLLILLLIAIGWRRRGKKKQAIT